MQKTADQKYNDYKKATVQSLDADLIETEDVYYLKVAVPGINKEDISIEAGDNDITIEATFKAYIEEFEEDETAEVIVSSLKSGTCVKTVRFENSIDIENISAKFNNGTVTVSIPKLIIPKHKVNVE
ncbi:MAG: Hsp20/alpha crystallin family protein [Methanobrevibacter sp.]